MTDWVQIISSVGFPIACCCFMGYFIISTMKDFMRIIENNTDALKELTIKLGEEK